MKRKGISSEEFRKLKSKGKQQGRETTELENRLYKKLLFDESNGKITSIVHQPKKLKLAYLSTYKADAMCFNIKSQRWEYWEAKNEWWKLKDDGGWQKLKFAAQTYQQYDFFLYEQKKDGRLVIQKIKIDETLGV